MLEETIPARTPRKDTHAEAMEYVRRWYAVLDHPDPESARGVEDLEAHFSFPCSLREERKPRHIVPTEVTDARGMAEWRKRWQETIISHRSEVVAVRVVNEGPGSIRVRWEAHVDAMARGPFGKGKMPTKWAVRVEATVLRGPDQSLSRFVDYVITEAKVRPFGFPQFSTAL